MECPVFCKGIVMETDSVFECENHEYNIRGNLIIFFNKNL